jgi:pimeloyl-ACP methyl ester carboxylesterase
MARALTAIPVLLAVAAFGACGGDGGGSSESFPGTADYSVSTTKLDRELACKGGKGNLSGEGENDPVLLVPGTTTREVDWGRNYWRALPDRGFEVCWVQLPDVFGDIQTSAEYVARAVEVIHEATGGQIDVVGHSQGGVSARWAVKWFPAGAFVDDQIALAAPNHGGVIADRETARGKAPEFEWQLRTDASFIRALNGGDESPGSADYTSIYSKTDEQLRSVVTPRVEQATNVLLQDLCPGRQVTHIGIVSDDVAYSLVIDALSHPGTADPDRAGVDCAADKLPGAGNAPPENSQGVNFHVTDHEPPLQPYARD